MEIEAGIVKESQVVYLLAGVRKMIEQSGNRGELGRLKFYCDWALHSRLSGPPAQDVVRILESIYKCMVNNERAQEYSEAMRLMKFDLLKEDLSMFLNKFGLDDLTKNTNAWVAFIYLYSRVVEDCPLAIPQNVQTDIQKIVIGLENGKNLIDDHLPFKVKWQFRATGNLPPAEYFILNSYSIAKVGRL